MSDIYLQLTKKFGKRRAVIDACSDAPQFIAEGLRKYGVEVVGLKNYRLKDHVIKSMLGENDVLLTRDYRFKRRLGAKAILLPRGSRLNEDRARRYGYVITNKARKRSKEMVAYEIAEGLADFKIKRGMRMLFTKKAKNEKGWTIREPV